MIVYTQVRNFEIDFPVQKKKKGSLSMKNDSEIFRRILTGFVAEEDPLLSMLKWMMEQLMQIEAEQKVGAQKGEHSNARQSYFSAYRPRRFDTRVGTVYLMIPKIRKGGYVPFFLTEKNAVNRP